jgi:ABC-type sugar transport system substrate-binding protein
MKKVLVVTLVVLMVVSMLVSCSQPASPPSEEPKAPTEDTKAPEQEKEPEQQGEEGKAWKIAVMPKLIGIPYFNASEKGALQAGKDMGLDVQYVGPTNADATEQVKMIEDLINQGIDALCVAPNDPAALSPVLKKAKDAGIVVLDWDTPANPEDVVYSINQVDQQEYAQLYFDKAVELAGKDDFKYAILTGGLNAANLNGWIDAGLEYAKEKYPNLQLVTERVPTDESQQLAYQKTLELIAAYPDLEVILGYSTPTPLGAAKAVREKNLIDSIIVVGSTTPNDSVEYLDDGSLDLGFLWDPSKLGYLAVFAAKEVLEGRELSDGQEVPNVGKISVDGKIVIMGPPSVWTKENVRDYDF